MYGFLLPNSNLKLNLFMRPSFYQWRVLRNLIPHVGKELLYKNLKGKDSASWLLKIGTMSICHMLGSAFALHLVHTLNHLEFTICQTLCWSIQQTQLGRRCGPCPQGDLCLGRRKNAYHKLSAMGEEDEFLMVQKWREDWSWLLKVNRYCKCRN